MPRLDGIAATRLLRAPAPPAAGASCSPPSTPTSSSCAPCRPGPRASCSRTLAPADIVRAIEAVHAGEGTLSPSIARRLIAMVAGDPDTAARQERARRQLASLTAARARGGRRRRPGAVQRRDRRQPAHERGHGQGARVQAAGQVRRGQPRPDRPARPELRATRGSRSKRVFLRPCHRLLAISSWATASAFGKASGPVPCPDIMSDMAAKFSGVLLDFAGTLFDQEDERETLRAIGVPAPESADVALALSRADRLAATPALMPPRLARQWERRDLTPEGHRAAYAGLLRRGWPASRRG